MNDCQRYGKDTAAMSTPTTTVYTTMDPEGYIVEHGGMLKTGPFRSWDRAVRWYREELDMDLTERAPQVDAFERALVDAGGTVQVDRRAPGRSTLHAHTCAECGLLRTCSQEPCSWRARDGRVRDGEWVCFVCVDKRSGVMEAAT